MKTKRAAKEYTCRECKGTIKKGDRVARKSIDTGYVTGVKLGNTTLWNDTPYRIKVVIWDPCANGVAS